MDFSIRKIGRLFVAGIMALASLGAARRETGVADYDPTDAMGYESAVAYVPPPPVHPRA